MKIAVDIDGTLCWSNLPVFLEECNKTFDLGIDEEVLKRLEDKEEFYVLPEVAARLTQEEYFCYELAWVEFRERCLLDSLVMDHAVAGVTRLATFGDVAYYTARYSDDHEILLEIKKASKQWLRHHKFINNHKVVFCDDISGKIAKILKIAKNDYILLVDDSYKGVLEVIERLDDVDKYLLLEKLMLVALRANADELPSTDFNVIALPSWDEIETVIERIHDHGKRQAETTAKYTATETTTKYASSQTAVRSKYGKTASR